MLQQLWAEAPERQLSESPCWWLETALHLSPPWEFGHTANKRIDSSTKVLQSTALRSRQIWRHRRVAQLLSISWPDKREANSLADPWQILTTWASKLRDCQGNQKNVRGAAAKLQTKRGENVAKSSLLVSAVLHPADWFHSWHNDIWRAVWSYPSYPSIWLLLNIHCQAAICQKYSPMPHSRWHWNMPSFEDMTSAPFLLWKVWHHDIHIL